MMKRKIAIVSVICAMFVGVFCGIIAIGKDTNAYVANKGACAAIYWTGKQTHYSVDSGKQKTSETVLKSSSLKANAAARVKICTTKVDKNGVISGSVKATYINPTAKENKKTKTIKLFKKCFTEETRVVCKKKNGDGIQGAYTKGKTKFYDFVIEFAGQFKQKMSTEKVNKTVRNIPTGTKVVTGGSLLKGYKYDFTLQDTIYWDPDMSKEGTDKAARTSLSGGEWTGGDPDNPGGTNGGSNSDADPCYSGAGVLGHVICPLLKNIGEYADSAYVNLIQPLLMLEPELLSQESDSGTFKAWGFFQNFANIAFIIMLLIVILSQVTGVGLSNYGIKKTLPKLVIAVILINLSFIICQLAVDLSNVLGVGLKSLMDGLTEQLQADVTVSQVNFNADANTTVDSWKTGDTVAALALLAGVIAGPGTILAQGFAVLLPLIFAAITVVVAIMFFFILLSVRKAGVVLLVVLSPIAFVCYMLPNTKKLFDRWLKAFTGLLLLFPICGLIIGGGDFASTILLSVNNNNGTIDFFYALTAMVVGIVPVFFIPLLLKNSMSGLGNIGAKISGAGRSFSGGVNKRIAKSDWYQDSRARLAAGRQGGLRQRLADSRFGRATGARGQLARNKIALNKRMADQGSIDAAYGENFLLKTQTANEMKRLESTGEINDSGRLKSGLTRALLSNDQAKINAYSDALLAKGDSGRDDFGEAWSAAIAQGFGKRNNAADVAAAKAASNNVMENHAADVKNNARSLFETMNDASNGNIHTREQVDPNRLIENIKPDTAVNMDDTEFKLTTGYDKSGNQVLQHVNLSDKNQQILENTAATVNSSPELQRGAKGGRRSAFRDIAGGSTRRQRPQPHSDPDNPPLWDQ